ncbi:uncharacterized protein [Diadema antillarum]|uniref:uncharacterized protein n=1 Tax=Diadema antillarum TaxID=105358 RepID=UPI003A8BFF7C
MSRLTLSVVLGLLVITLKAEDVETNPGPRLPKYPKQPFMEALTNLIESIAASNTGAPIWIAGDFNLPDIKWDTDQVIKHQYPKDSTRHSQLWFNTTTKRICHRKTRSYAKAKRTQKERDWKRYRKLKKEAQTSCRKAYNKYLNDIISSEPGASKRLGAIIKAKRCDQTGVASLEEGQQLFTDPKTKADLLNRQFASVFTRDSASTLPDLGPSPHPAMNDISVNTNGIVKLLKNLNPYKASRPDGVPAKLLKELAEEVAPAITFLYLASLDQGGIEDKGQTDPILLDFAKSFDKVSHRLLLHKMQHYGIRGHTLRWVEEFLSGRSQQVLVDGKISSRANVKSGVPQGSVLGSLLFLIFINDLPDCIKTSKTRLFADDCVLYKRISSKDDATPLQGNLDSLQKWERTWCMQFHPAKCQVIRVTKKRKPFSFPYHIHETLLEEVSSARYLGLHVDNKLSFNSHVDITSKKANSIRAFLQRNFNHCCKKIEEMTYKTYVRPIVEYAAASWDPHTRRNINRIEQMQCCTL